MKTPFKASALTLILILSAAVAQPSRADEAFRKKHPRRAEVNKRIHHQNERIEKGVADGKISANEALALKQREAAIKAKEVQEVKANGGHLTQPEKKELNQELNQAGKDIKSAVTK